MKNNKKELCTYCEKGWSLGRNFDIGIETEASIVENNILWFSHVEEYHGGELKIKIKYCPMCGRKLKDIMNSTLARFARQSIKDGLRKLPKDYIRQFNRMYSPNDLDADIDSVVDFMPDDKLDWALTQVENSIIKLSKN